MKLLNFLLKGALTHFLPSVMALIVTVKSKEVKAGRLFHIAYVLKSELQRKLCNFIFMTHFKVKMLLSFISL